MVISKRNIKSYIVCGAIGLLFMNSSITFAATLDLTLEESIGLALKNNPAINIAVQDKVKAEWNVAETNAGKLPSLSFGSNYNVNGSSLDSGSQDKVSNNLRLNWQLYTGGRLENQIDQAKLGLTSAELGVAKSKQQIKLDVTTGYFNLLQAQNMVKVGQETVDNLKQHLQIVRAKQEAGAVPKSDVLRAEVEMANAEQNLIKVQNSNDVAEAYLLNVMNIDAEMEVVLKSELLYEMDNRSLTEVLEFASRRPDIAQASLAVGMAEKSIDIATSNKRPTVGLSASTGWNDKILPDDSSWSVGIAASWNIFDGGVTKAKIRQAEAMHEKSNLQAEQIKDAAFLETRQGYLGMKEAEKRLSTSNVTASKANEDLFIAREKYKAGVGTNLDVIDAQLALTQARTNNIQALYDYNISRAKLNKAIGVVVE